MKLRYGLEDRPSVLATTLYALQWLALCLPFVVIIGTVAAGQPFMDPALKTVYLQRAAFVTGLMLLGQALFGHRLTLVAGPATALLLGLTGSHATPEANYTAIAVCGALLATLSACGFFGAVRGLFTSRVVATVVLLIAFTMAPTVVRLLTAGDPATSASRLSFAVFHVSALFLAHRFLPAGIRSSLIVAGMVGGAAAFFGVFGVMESLGQPAVIAPFFSGIAKPVFDAGAIVSFFFCFLALSLNEVGSIQSVVPLLEPDGMEGRVRSGMTVTGIVNLVAGLLGVIGPVDFSLSPGVISASGCGSRIPLIPVAVIVLLASFSPLALGVAGAIPATVIGGTLVYALAGQVAAGFSTAFSGGTYTFEDGLVIGLPLVAGTVTAILPATALEGFPPAILSVAGNGFVVGVVAVLVLDRMFHR